MMTCNWLGLDMAALGLVASVPDVSVKMDNAISDRVSSVTLVNRDGIFDESSATSILHGTKWRGSRIVVADEFGTICSGTVTDGVSSGADLSLEIQSDFSRMFASVLDKTVIGTDPATAIYELAVSAGVPLSSLDLVSFKRAADRFEQAGIIVNAIASKQYATKLIDAINALAEMGSLRVWLDDKIHVAHLPSPAAGATYLQTVKARDIIGNAQYGAVAASEQTDGYSLGYLGDSAGALPATGGKTGTDARVWSQAYNATSQWQIADVHSAHALGAIRVAQDGARRTASVPVRADGSIQTDIGHLCLIDSAPWGGNPGILTGYTRKNGILTLELLEATE